MKEECKPNPKQAALYESAMIKDIRRSNPVGAVAAAWALIYLGKSDVVWRRLLIHMSEDIGVGQANAPAQIMALYQSHKILSETSADTTYEADNVADLPTIHAVMLMCHAYKNRAADDALAYHSRKGLEHYEIPDYAVDWHSPAGRRKGRGVEHWLEEASKTFEPDVPFTSNPWKDKVANLLRIESAVYDALNTSEEE